jgi:hypothetical protein
MGIPTAITGFLVWWLKRYMDKRDQEREIREKNTEKLMLLIMQIAVYAISPTRQLIHDKMARTVCVDMASQMIFETEAELIAYRQRRAAESAAKADY